MGLEGIAEEERVDQRCSLRTKSRAVRPHICRLKGETVSGR